MKEFMNEKAIPLLALVTVAALAFSGKVAGTEAMAFIAGVIIGAPQMLPKGVK